MKVLLTGSTGFIGGEVLRRTLAHPSVTEAVVLSRRKVTDPAVINDPKFKNLIHTDFEKYDDEAVKQIQGSEACIWSVMLRDKSGDSEPY
jgi:nucleoside-diphosphate-sugar epimerase